jgi:hypothetical protein
MNASVAPSRRPRRRVWFPEIADPDVEIANALTHFRFDAKLRYGEDISVDLANLGRPHLLRPFIHTLWRICQIGGPAGARSTAACYVKSVRFFWAYLDKLHPAIRRPLALTAEHINGFERWLAGESYSAITSYQVMAKLTGCLRFMHEADPTIISANLLARLDHVSFRYCGPGPRRDSYSERVTASLRRASQRDIIAIHQRIVVDSERILRDGDPDGGGNAATQAAFKMIAADLLKDEIVSQSDPAFRRLYARRREAGLDNRTLVQDLHRHLYLSSADIVPFLVLFSLETGIEIECCKELSANCLKNAASGSVEIEYCKRRARGAEWHRLRVRDGSSGTPGGLLRMAMRLTERARRLLKSDRLWCHYSLASLVVGIKQPTQPILSAFVDRHGIVDDAGKPLRLVLARLRKTHKAEWYRRTNGQMEQFAVGHTAEVAANHYADIPALRPLHEETVAAGLQDALDAALAPRVVPPKLELRMRKEPAKAGLPMPPAEVVAFLDGAQDLWLASCSGFYASPFGNKGQPCPVPFWGCLECSNAVITSRKLPPLVQFLEFMTAQRDSLPAADWAAKFGRAHRRIAEQILPAFPAAIVAAARTVAASQASLLHLPPEVAA